MKITGYEVCVIDIRQFADPSIFDHNDELEKWLDTVPLGSNYSEQNNCILNHYIDCNKESTLRYIVSLNHSDQYKIIMTTNQFDFMMKINESHNLIKYMANGYYHGIGREINGFSDIDAKIVWTNHVGHCQTLKIKNKTQETKQQIPIDVNKNIGESTICAMRPCAISQCESLQLTYL